MEELLEINEKLQKIESLLTVSKIVLNIDEVVQLTSLSKSTIYKLTSAGGIPHFKQAKHLYFDRKEIESWLKSNRIKTTDEISKEASSFIILNKKGGEK